MLVAGALQALKHTRPELDLAWLIDRRFHPLFAAIDGIELIAVDRPRSPADYAAIAWRLRPRHWDVVLALQANLRANLLYPFIPSAERIVFDRARAREGHRWLRGRSIVPDGPHLLDDFLAFVRTLAPAIDSPRWDIPLPEAAVRWADEIRAGPGLCVVVHPGTSRSERCWSADNYAALIRHLAEHRGARILLTGGGDGAARRLARQVSERSPAVDLSARTDLPRFAALLKAADLVIAPDTSAIHVARAFETPVIGLYASAPSSLTGPYRWPHAAIDAYPRAYRARYGHLPEQSRRIKRLRRGAPMAHIDVRRVIEAAERALDHALAGH